MGKKNKKKECCENDSVQNFLNWVASLSYGEYDFYCNKELHKALGLENPDEPEYVYIVDWWDDDLECVSTETFNLEQEVIDFLGKIDDANIVCVQRAVIDKHYDVQIKKEIKLIDAEEK